MSQEKLEIDVSFPSLRATSCMEYYLNRVLILSHFVLIKVKYM